MRRLDVNGRLKTSRREAARSNGPRFFVKAATTSTTRTRPTGRNGTGKILCQ
jgi:hypothetical protein